MTDWADPNTWGIEPHQFRMYAGENAEHECLVDEEDYLFFTQWLWQPQKNKGKIYFRRALTLRSNGERYSGSIYLHVEILKRAQGEAPTRRRTLADHWNGNSLDNRRQNLRYVTKRQNNQNRFGSHYYKEHACHP